MNEKISSADAHALSTAIQKILSTEVLEKDITGKLPTVDTLCDSNKVYSGKVSILFVDMRESSKLPEKLNAEQLVKLYRSYIRTVVQAVRYAGGAVRDFMGDGVLAVFIDDESGKSEDQAVYAARYIVTAIDKMLNPMLDKLLHHRISYGIGIHTGEISLSKVGMKGREQDGSAENEFGIAWIGNSTNLACKQSAVVSKGTIFISNSTYVGLTNNDKNTRWDAYMTTNGSNILKGYVAKHYYLSLDEDITPCVAQTDSNQDKLEKIIEKVDDFIVRTEILKEKQKELDGKEMVLSKKEELLNTREKSLNRAKYSFYREALRSAHCNSEYTQIMGQEFWEENLQSLISAGAQLGKTEQEVKQDVSYIMVNIYENLGLYEYAYEYLVHQANGFEWMLLSVTKDVVTKTGCYRRLKDAIDVRINKGDLLPDDLKEFELIRDWINFTCEIAPVNDN